MGTPGRSPQLRPHPHHVMLLTALFTLALSAHQTAAATTSGSSCAVSMAPQGLPLPSCPPSNATLDDAKAIAWKLAPRVFLHPLEPWSWQSIDEWFAAAQLIMPDYKPAGNSSYDFVLRKGGLSLAWLTRSFVTLMNSTSLSPAEKQRLLAGAGFDAAGHSKAKVFYTVQDYNEGTWLFNFNLFYSWNGCSNQAFVLSFNGTKEVLEYYMCPAGVHEVDLERISMLVCKSDQKIKQLAYSQHGWEEVRNCEVAGQCTFDENGHPIAYAGLHGHGNYFEASPLIVYDYINGTVPSTSISLNNLGGVWVADRTLADPNKTFVPTPDNIVYIPPFEAIFNNSIANFSWAIYPGNLGAGNALTLPQINITCLYANQTREGKCNETSHPEATRVLNTAINVLGAVPVLGAYEGSAYIVKDNTNSTVPYPSITGPLYRPFTYLWVPEKGAPIHARNFNVVTCPWDVSSVQPLPTLQQYDTGVSTLITYLWGICLGAFLFSVVMVLIFSLPMLMDKTATAKRVISRTLTGMHVGREAFQRAMSKGAAAWDRTAAATKEVASETLAYANKLTGSNKSIRALNKGPTEAAGLAATGAAGATSTLEQPSQSRSFEAAPAPSPGKRLSDEEAPLPEPAGKVLQSAPSQEQLSREESPASSTRARVWALLAVGLFIAGVVLVALGAEAFWSNSLASFATELSGKTSIMKTLRILIGLGMALIGLCDVISFIIIFLAKPKYLDFGRFRVRNYLGSHDWVNRHSFNIHIVVIGLVIIVINVSAILFALGFIIVVTQIVARIACTEIGQIDAVGITLDEVCITVPTINEDPICGWQALQLCYDVTGMGVINLVLGAACLLWSHLTWLLMLMLSLWRFYNFEMVEEGLWGPGAKDEKKPGGEEEEEAAVEPAEPVNVSGGSSSL